jgi:two-component system response regulator
MTDAPILLVDDNPDDVALTVRAFAKNGIGNPIIVASDGEECLTRLTLGEGMNPLPVIILLDINLPKISGLELLRHIRACEHTYGIPVIMLTTSREEHDVIESYRLGANSYVRKPVGFGEFLSIIQVLGAYWLQVNEPPPLVAAAP